MTATNHALSGALIGAFLALPVAIPVALVSHFVLDALPHYGINHNHHSIPSTYKTVVFSDTAIALALAVTAAIFHKWDMLIAGSVAYLPDVSVVSYYLRHGGDMDIKAENKFMKFHLGIQHEYPWGIIPELIVGATMFPIFIAQLLKS
ncbi:hypothetical protein HYW35_01850 [Candidatus Saccharibacteria bacterium]|nr:hypothetical protein [Candidatus Saccharibacteria bacterium]